MWNKRPAGHSSFFRYGVALMVISSLLFLRYGLPATRIPKSHQHELGYFHRVITGNIYSNGGMLQSKFGMLLRLSRDGGEYYYTHHPTLYTVILYGAFMSMGSYAFIVLPLVVSIGVIVLTYAVVARAYSVTVGFWAAILLAVHPLFLRYSLFVNYDPLTLFLAVFANALFVWGILERDRPMWRMLYGTLIVAMLVDWPGYVLTYAIAGCYLWKVRKLKPDRHVFALGLLPVVMFLLFLGHNVWQTGSLNGGNLFRTFLGRVSNVGEVDFFGNLRSVRPGYANYGEFLTFLGTNMTRHIRPFYILAAIAGLVTLKNWRIRLFSLLQFFVGIAFLLVFNSFAYDHDFSLLQVLPVFAVLSALSMHTVIQRLPDRAVGWLQSHGIAREGLYHLCLGVIAVTLIAQTARSFAM